SRRASPSTGRSAPRRPSGRGGPRSPPPRSRVAEFAEDLVGVLAEDLVVTEDRPRGNADRLERLEPHRGRRRQEPRLKQRLELLPVADTLRGSREPRVVDELLHLEHRADVLPGLL